MPFVWRVCYDVGGCNFVTTERGRCDLSCMSSVGMLECESHCGVLCIAAEHGRQLATAMYV